MVDRAEIMVSDCGLSVAIEFRNKFLEECICVAVVGLTYHFYSDVEQDDEQVETCIDADGEPCKIQKLLKVNAVKELIRGIKKNLPIMKLGAMDQDVR